jgi:hypothetical protein
LFPFNAQNISFHVLLAFKVSVGKSAVILMGFLCHFIFLSYSLQYSFLVLCANCFTYDMLWKGSILVMSVWCPGSFLYLNGYLFPEIWEYFAIILLNILHIPLACYSSPSLMPMIHRFGLLME